MLKKISATLLLAACFSPLAQASPVNFLYEACPTCAPKDLAYSAGEFDQIYAVVSEAGANNTQPASISAEALSKLLLQIKLVAGNKEVPWLEEESAQSLANGIAKFLAKANSAQEGIFLVTSRTSSGIISGKLGNSGRVFVNQQGLNLIVGEAHVEFFNAYRATRMIRKFEFGSRKQASKVVLQSPYLQAGRRDWLSLPLQVQASVPVAPAAVSLSLPAAAPASPAALAPAAPLAAPAPSAASIEQTFQAHESRLKGLKRLREQNLISEEEYQAKRREILKDL